MTVNQSILKIFSLSTPEESSLVYYNVSMARFILETDNPSGRTICLVRLGRTKVDNLSGRIIRLCVSLVFT